MGFALPVGWRGMSLPVEAVALRVVPGALGVVTVGLGVGITGVGGATPRGAVGLTVGVVGAAGAVGGVTTGGGETLGGPTTPCAPAGDTAAKRAAATNPPTTWQARILDATPMRRSLIAMRIETLPRKPAAAQPQPATNVNERLLVFVLATVLR